MTWIWPTLAFILGLTTAYFAYVAFLYKQMAHDFRAMVDQLHATRNQFLLDVLEKARYNRTVPQNKKEPKS